MDAGDVSDGILSNAVDVSETSASMLSGAVKK